MAPPSEPGDRSARSPRASVRRYGGDWQPLLESFSDAVAALALPDTAWAVLSCPVEGMELAGDFVSFIDRDGDGRVRADDVREAVAWTADMLDDWMGVTAGDAELRLATLSAAAHGHRVTAEALSARLGAGEQARLALPQLRDTQALCRCGDRDGDGVVPVSCLPPEQRPHAEVVLGVIPPEIDRHGHPGITRAVLARFAEARDLRLAWERERAVYHPWGDDSAALADDVIAADRAVRAWFALCDVASVDAAAASALDRPDTKGVAPRDPDGVQSIVDALPLAPVAPDGALPWQAVRPGALRVVLKRLRDALFAHDPTLTREAWAARVAIAEGIIAWRARGEALAANGLDLAVLERLDDAALESLGVLCDLDADNRQHLNHLGELEKLLVYQRDLFAFCRNFIAFTDLMAPDRRALFERGTLVIAGRELHFSMRVRDIEAHKSRAMESGIFVLYVEVSYRYEVDDVAVLEIVAVPVTRGTGDGLRKGRRGIFLDRGGRYHEAVVRDVVENPVSLNEALFAPFGRIGQYLSGKLEKLTERFDGDFDKQVSEMSKAQPPAAAAPTGGMNPLMGGTVAFAALGSAFAFITKQLSEIGGPRILLALVVTALLVAVPTVLLAAIRLYRRNLAGLISASGWALNDRMRLTASLGRLFTRRPAVGAVARSRTQDQALAELRRVDPGAAARQRTVLALRIASMATVLVLLIAVALPSARLPWLDPVVWGAAGLHVALLLWVLVGLARARRFRPVYWWPIVTSFPVAILALVYYLADAGVGAGG